MEIEVYVKRQRELADQYEKDIRWLSLEYAQSHSSINIGDFVTDHIGTIKVEAFGLNNGYGGYSSSDMPSMIYKGTEYTKAGKPRKDGSKRSVYQTNLVKEK